MKFIALFFLLTITLSAQTVSRTELRNTNGVLNTRISTNATAVNARQAATESTNATQTSGINAANATNAAQTIAIAGKQTGSITLSNFVAYLVANGVTNIAAGTNAVLYVANGTLIINGTGSGTGSAFETNNIDVLGVVTNLLADHIDTETFFVGVLIPTNTVYISRTNFAVSNATNYVADFTKSEQTITVAGGINFLHGTNLWANATNAYVCFSLMNFSGSDRTLSIPAAWRRTLNFPTILTNGTVTQLALKNYGGLSQSNILAAAAQF